MVDIALKSVVILEMDVKKYSLDEIFSILRESTMILASKQVTVISEDDGIKKRTSMTLHDFIAMSVASELTSDDSRVISAEPRENVIAAMKANYYEEVAFPNYEHFGISMLGGKRKTRRSGR